MLLNKFSHNVVIIVQEIIQGTKALLYLNYYTQVLTGEKKSGSEGLGYHLYFSIPLWETTLTRAVNPSFAPYSIIIVYIATSYTWTCTRNMLYSPPSPSLKSATVPEVTYQTRATLES